jgi:hypothetical protein
MKRALIIAALATAMLLAIAAPAFATDSVVNYKLTISTYWDADSDGTWDACEPPLGGTAVYIPSLDKLVITDCCGWVKLCVSYGTTVHAYPVYVDNLKYGPYNWVSEATPASGYYGTAKVKMCGNRCMLFGISPDWKVPYCAPCEPASCEQVQCKPCDPCKPCMCPPMCKCGCGHHRFD